MMWKWLVLTVIIIAQTTSVFSQNGNVLIVNGSTDYAEIPDDPQLRPSSLTIESWVSLNAFPEQSIVGVVIKRTGMGGIDANWQMEVVNQYNIRFSYFDGSTWQMVDTETSPIALLNHWYHVAVTYNSGEIKIYVDGTLLKTAADYPPLRTDYTGSIQIGRGAEGYLSAKLDEVRIWNFARTGLEIQNSMNDVLTGNESGLVAYYQFEETGSGENITVSNSSANGASFNGLTQGTESTPYFLGRNNHYVLGSPTNQLNTSEWSLQDFALSDFREFISKPENFGVIGTVTTPVEIEDLSAITSESVSGLNGMFISYWNETESEAYKNTIINAFLSGMDLWLLEDSDGYDNLGETLGISSTGGSGTPSNGINDLFSGPFGNASNVNSYGDFNQLDSASVVSSGGIIAARNAEGQITMAYWPKGAYAEGSGSLVIFTDVDIISNYFNAGAYKPSLSSNGILALNTMAWLIEEHGALPVELSEFWALVHSETVVLNWSTVTESNNVGWEVEVSGQQSAVSNQQWTKIGFVAGKGTTTESQNYSFAFSRSEFKVQSHQFRLKQIDHDGKFSYSKILTVDLTPDKISLSQNYPNPFNPNTAISYQLSAVSHVKLVVFDLLGREVATLVNEEKPAGNYSVNFSAVNLPSGVYFYKLAAGSFNETRKMTILR